MSRDGKRPIFIVRQCGKSHYVDVRTAEGKRPFKLCYDSGSENTYIDLEVAQAWGLVDGKHPLVPYLESTTVDSNGNQHKSYRLTDVTLFLKCPDGQWRSSHGPIEVNLDSKINKYGRLFGVSHMRTLRDNVRYIIDFAKCARR